MKGLSDPKIQNLGFVLLILKTLFVNSLLSVVLPQAVFVYVLIYWLLPNYFYKKREPLIICCVITCFLITYLFVSMMFKYFTPLFNYILGISNNLARFDFVKAMQPTIRDQITTLPIVAGFALMIKLIKRWWLKQKETEQLVKEKAKAELQLLKAQVHPHFLFNTLNNIYFFTLTNSAQAPEMIKKLSGMLHYILNECNHPLVPVAKEINMIRDYMALEKIRYGEQMQMAIEMKGDYSDKMIAPLLLIPFAENSFKHGTSKMIAHPWLNLSIAIENNILHFLIGNSRPQTNELTSAKGNIGLKNVRKRLQLLYPDAHELSIVEQAETFTVQLTIKLEEVITSSSDSEESKPLTAYAMA